MSKTSTIREFKRHIVSAKLAYGVPISLLDITCTRIGATRLGVTRHATPNDEYLANTLPY